MKTFTPDELDKEIYLKYKNIIELYKISNIYLIKDKYDIKENTLIDNKIYVTKPLIESLPINEYFTIVCMSKPNESCKTYKLLTLNKLLDEYNSINEIKESINNFNKDSIKLEYNNKTKYLNNKYLEIYKLLRMKEKHLWDDFEESSNDSNDS